MRILNLLAAFTVGLGLAQSTASAQHPGKPIQVVVPYPAGGPSDQTARLLFEVVSRALAQRVVVENKPGGSGWIAIQSVMKAPPDGFTLLWGVSSMVGLPHLQKSTPDQAMTILTPVSLVGRFIYGIAINPQLPSRSLAEFLAHARANPGNLNYASNNWSEYITTAQFMRTAGIDLLRVPYKGAAQSIPDLVANRVQINIGPVMPLLPYVKSGQLRLLATYSTTRGRVTAEVPTIGEVGMPAMFAPSWQAVFAPPGTDRKIVERLAREISVALQDREFREKLELLAFQPEASTPAALGSLVEADITKWVAFVRENGIVPE